MVKMSELIVMLTYNDVTVENAKEVFDSCKDLPVSYWGFKNIGLPLPQMKELVSMMKSEGKTTFLEVVTLDEAACLQGAETALSCGFDYLLGTVFFPSVNTYTREHGIRYLPFCGNISGHPSILSGSIQEIVDDALRLQSEGVQGLDLLAYRHKEDPENLIREIVAGINIPVVVAGSISSFERIHIVQDLNPWTFTIGTALFEKKFTDKPSFRDQLKAVIDVL